MVPTALHWLSFDMPFARSTETRQATTDTMPTMQLARMAEWIVSQYLTLLGAARDTKAHVTLDVGSDAAERKMIHIAGAQYHGQQRALWLYDA